MSGGGRLDNVIDAFSPENIFLDIAVSFIWLIAALASIYFPLLNETVIRLFLALPIIIFLPGYSLIAAFFPSKDEPGFIERIAISLGLSIAFVPLAGLGLNYTPWGIDIDSVTVTLAVFTAVILVVAQYRRFMLPEERRYTPPFKSFYQDLKGELFPREDLIWDKLLSIILLISVIMAIGAALFVITVPKEGEKFTEFYILDDMGFAADYSTVFNTNAQQDIIIGIANHEYQDTNYIIETFAVNQSFDKEFSVSSIAGMELIDRINVDVLDNETVEFQYNFTVISGSVNKIQFLLFKDSVPEEEVWGMDRINSSYLNLYLWVDVEGPSI